MTGVVYAQRSEAVDEFGVRELGYSLLDLAQGSHLELPAPHLGSSAHSGRVAVAAQAVGTLRPPMP